MTAGTPVHDFVLPRLDKIIADGVAAGFAEDVVIAVMVDLVTSSRINAPANDQDPSA